MDKTYLQLTAGRIVVESKLSKPAKLQLLNWVQSEATTFQIKAFLMDGKIVQLDEHAEQIVEDRFEQHPLNEGGWKTVAGMLLTSPIHWAAYRGIRAIFDKKSARCGVLAIGRKRDVCLWKLRAEEATKNASVFTKALADCKKHPAPEVCRAQGQKAIAKQKAIAVKNMAKIKNYSLKSMEKNAKSKEGIAKAADPNTKMI